MTNENINSNTKDSEIYFFSVKFKFNKSKQGVEKWDDEIIVFESNGAEELN